MSELTGKDIVKTLKSIDIDLGNTTEESFDWLCDNKDTQPLLVWLCSYINQNNVETGMESYEYATLLKEGNVLKDENLDEHLTELNSNYSGILDVDVKEINELKMKINSAQKEERVLCDLTSKALALDHKMNHELSKYSEYEAESKIKLETAADKLLPNGKLIDQIHGEINSSIGSYMNVVGQFSNPTADKYFLSQIQFNCYKEHCDNYNTNINLWIENEFEVDKMIKTITTLKTKSSNSESNFEFLHDELQRLNNCIEDSIIKKIKSECAEEELRTKNENLNKSLKVPLTEENYRIQTIQVTCRINALMEEFDRLCSSELQQTAQHFTENTINSVLLSYAQLKLNHSKDMVQKFEYLNTEVINSLAQIQLISSFFKVEKENQELLDNLMTDADLYMNKFNLNQYIQSQAVKKLELKYKSQKSLPLEKKSSLLKQIMMVILENYDDGDCISTQNCLAKIKLDRHFTELFKNEILTVRNKDYSNVTKIYQNKIKEMKSFIWCGPTSQPVYISYSYLEKSYYLKNILDKISNKQNNCLQIYKKAEDKLHKNKWFKQRRLLWTLFLIQPEQVLSTISKLEHHLIEQSKLMKPVENIEQFFV